MKNSKPESNADEIEIDVEELDNVRGGFGGGSLLPLLERLRKAGLLPLPLPLPLPLTPAK